jgi:S1-C subfamily serine protease
VVGPQGQARAKGIEVGDVIRTYHGVEITSRATLRERIEAAREAGVDDVTMTLLRGDETIEITLEPGRIGIGAVDRYREPVFE